MLNLVGHANDRCGFFWLKDNKLEYEQVPMDRLVELIKTEAAGNGGTIELAVLGACETADILVLHSPPKGVADVTSGGQSVGSTAIFEAIERIQPRFAFCGHIHDSWGHTGQIGDTQVVNLGPRHNWFDL